MKKRSTQELFAMKVLRKKQLMLKNQIRYAVSESSILKKMEHPFVLSLHYAFQVFQISKQNDKKYKKKKN